MRREIREEPDGKGVRVGVVVSRFNEFVTERLLSGALEALTECGVADTDTVVVRVPGAFELALAAKELARSGAVDGIVCLGAVIRGDTAHFEYVSKAATDGIRAVALEETLPVGFGVLTTETLEQALERSEDGRDHKGAEVARGVLEMVRVVRRLRERN